MSENPRLILAAFWLLASLRSLAAAGEAHTTVIIVGNLIGVIVGPFLAYKELRRGLAERKARQAVNR